METQNPDVSADLEKADDLEVFDDVRDVEPGTASGFGLLRVLGVLLGAGVLVAIVVVILAALLSARAPEPAVVCDGAASCDDLSLVQVQDLTALDLPAGSTVISGSYDEMPEGIVVTAVVQLSDPNADPFAGTAWFEISEDAFVEAGLDVPTALEAFLYYGATGENGSLEGDAAFAVDEDGNQVVVVRVLRAL